MGSDTVSKAQTRPCLVSLPVKSMSGPVHGLDWQTEMLKARSMRAVKPRWPTSTIVCFRQRAAAISHASSVARLPPRLKSGTCSAQSLSRLTDGPHIVRERRARSGMRRTTAGLRTEAKQSSSDQVFRQSRLHRLHICKHHTLYT